jgi:pimeloyl-ACP methyl ester carboxylesterase
VDPIHFHKHRRRERAPGKIANCPFAGVINLCEFPSATGTFEPSVPSFAAYPQLQRLRLLVEFVLIDTIPGPVQNPGELSIRRQSAILAEISKSGPSHGFLLRAQNFYNTDVFLGKRVSEQAVQSSWNIAAGASATASLACVPTWHEDFREDLARIDVPTLVIQGDADRILPITATGLRTAKLIKGARHFIVKDGPHCITWTHAEEVNGALLNFLGDKTGKLQKEVA